MGSTPPWAGVTPAPSDQTKMRDFVPVRNSWAGDHRCYSLKSVNWRAYARRPPSQGILWRGHRQRVFAIRKRSGAFRMGESRPYPITRLRLGGSILSPDGV